MLRDAESPRLAASNRWLATLAAFPATDLKAVSEHVSSERIDTKFVLSDASMQAVLESMADHYLILDVDGSRYTSYRTQYFDTESFALFRRHHAGGCNRYKVRTRTYLNTGLAFIEIKIKTPSGATRKLRQRLPEFSRSLSGAAADFVDAHSAHGAASLRPTLLNSFDRICLIGRERRERLTIDLDVSVAADSGSVSLPGIAVAELKQERHVGSRKDSAFLEAMRERHIRPTGFSKYCIGLLLAEPEIKHNLFKPQLRRLHRLLGEQNAA